MKKQTVRKFNSFLEEKESSTRNNQKQWRK